MSALSIPPEGTVERRAWDYVTTTSLAHKLAPPSPPSVWSDTPRAFRLERPGRPSELVQREARKKAVRPAALKDPRKRAEVLHTFLHQRIGGTTHETGGGARGERAADEREMLCGETVSVRAGVAEAPRDGQAQGVAAW
jgi:hypothetical protein